MNNGHLTDDDLQAFLDGSIPEAAGINKHLSDCPACRLALQQYRALYAALAYDPTPALSDGFAERVLAELPVEQDLTAKRRPHLAVIGDWAIPAMALVVITAVACYFVDLPTLLKALAGWADPSRLGDNAVVSAIGKFFAALGISRPAFLTGAAAVIAVLGLDRIIHRWRDHRRPVSYLI